MELEAADRAFLEQHPSAAMITLRPDGTPHAVRVAVGLVDGRLLSSATPERARTRHLRRDPRCTLFVFDSAWSYLTLETEATILEGPQVPDLSLRLFRTMQALRTPPPQPGTVLWEGRALPEDEFLRVMVAERRLLYEFEVRRAYGLH